MNLATVLPNPFNQHQPHTYGHKGFFVQVKFYTTEELKAIDETLPDTGASQKPGYYYDEVDGEGEVLGAPAGPYRTQEAAVRAWKKVVNRIA